MLPIYQQHKPEARIQKHHLQGQNSETPITVEQDGSRQPLMTVSGVNSWRIHVVILFIPNKHSMKVKIEYSLNSMLPNLNSGCNCSPQAYSCNNIHFDIVMYVIQIYQLHLHSLPPPRESTAGTESGHPR